MSEFTGPPPPPEPPPLAVPPPPPAPRAPGAARPRRPSRRRIAIAAAAIAAVLVGALTAVLLVTRPGSSPAAGTAPQQPSRSEQGITTEDQLLTAIRTQGLTPQRAEEEFALDVGPLPGVSVAGIKPDNGFDGTPAVEDLIGEWGSLTKAQQAAAAKLLTASVALPGPSPGTSSGSPSTSTPTTATDLHLTDFVTGAKSPCDSGIQLSAQTEDQQAFDYVHLIANAMAIEAADTMTPIPQFTVCLHLEPPENPGLFAEAVLYNPGYSYQPGGCEINVYNTRFEGLSGNTAAGILAHEAFHCFQQRLAETVETDNSVSGWITEGEATWVMEELWPGSSAPNEAWPKYAKSPLVNYANRVYDGVGVFGHEGDVEGDQSKVWLQLLKVFAAGEHHQDATALGVLMGGDSDRFLSSWGASYFEDQPHADWYMEGPGPLPIQAPDPKSMTIADGDNQFLANLGPYEAGYVKIGGDADILIVTLASGYGELHDNGYAVEQILDNVAPVALCLKVGGCKCPDGSPGASDQTTLAKYPVYVGLDGGSTSLVASAAGVSLDKYCQTPDQPLPPGSGAPSAPGGGGSSGGSEPETPSPPAAHSSGDPHLLTFDGQSYDMQAAGEFTLVQSTVDDLLIQTRTVPLPGPHPLVAVNAAVAARMNGHRVTLQLENGELAVRIDGVVDSYEETDVGQGSVQRLGTELGAAYVVEWPDGTTMKVDQMGSVGLDVTVVPAAGRAGQLVGLLGTDSGSSSAEFVTPDGTDLGSTPSAQTIDGQYADSWRITQADSLFDYAPGQTTATFTLPSFPSSYVDSTTIQGAAQATQECQADGITDPHLLADCVVDVSSSPDHAVLSHYAQAQVVTTVHYDLAHNLPPGAPASPATAAPGSTPTAGASATPTSNPRATLVDTGNLDTSSEEQSFSFTANAGAVIWIGSGGAACEPGDIAMTLTDPQGKTLVPDVDSGLGGNPKSYQQFSPCEGGDRFNAATTGTYQLEANVDHGYSGAYSVPIIFERSDIVRQAAYGQTLSGTIPDLGSHDVYTFTAHGGDLVQIKGPGCSFTPGSAGDDAEGVGNVVIFDSSGKRLGVMDCGLIGNTGWFQIPPTGSTPFAGETGTPVPGVATYTLVVNGQDVGPFAYSFTLQKGTCTVAGGCG